MTNGARGSVKGKLNSSPQRVIYRLAMKVAEFVREILTVIQSGLGVMLGMNLMTV